MNDELFDAAALADFYRDLAENGGQVQLVCSGYWCQADGDCPKLGSNKAHWRIYRKPEPLELWINQYPPVNDSHEFMVHKSMESADMSAYAREERIRRIHVREVIE